MPAARIGSAFVPFAGNLADILVCSRVVGNDNTVLART